MRFRLVMLVRWMLALSLLTCSAAAFAQPEDSDTASDSETADVLLDKGQTLFDDQQYEESIQTLSALVARKDIPAKKRINALTLMSYNHIVLGNLGQAKGLVWSIYAEDENYALAETESPRFRDFFEKHKQTWIDADQPGKARTDEPANVTVKHSSPSQAEPGLPISLTGNIDDPDANVARVNIYYRTGTEGKFEMAPVKFAMRKFSVDIPASFVKAPRVEYYIEAVNSQDVPVANRGDAAAPLRVSIAGDEGSVATSAALWVPIGLSVATIIAVTVGLFAGGVVGSSSESNVMVNVFEL